MEKKKDVTNVDRHTDKQTDAHSEYSVNSRTDSQLCSCSYSPWPSAET